MTPPANTYYVHSLARSPRLQPPEQLKIRLQMDFSEKQRSGFESLLNICLPNLRLLLSLWHPVTGTTCATIQADEPASGVLIISIMKTQVNSRSDLTPSLAYVTRSNMAQVLGSMMETHCY